MKPASHAGCHILPFPDAVRNIGNVCLQLCDGASAAEKEKWSLRPPQEFHYLNQSSCYNLPRVSNAEEYRVLLIAYAFHANV